MKRITKLIYLALGSCLIAGLNASCELVSENYGAVSYTHLTLPTIA